MLDRSHHLPLLIVVVFGLTVWLGASTREAGAQELQLAPPSLGTRAVGSEGGGLLTPRSGPRRATLGGHALAVSLDALEPDGEGEGEAQAAQGGTEGETEDGTEGEEQRKEADPDGERTRREIKNGLYLLFFYEHDPSDMETFLHVLGLYWYRDTPSVNFQLIVPAFAYWRWKDSEEHFGLATPLFWHSQGAEHTYTGAWLYHRWRSPKTRFDALAPLYWHHHDLVEDDDLYILGPAYMRFHPEETEYGLLPLMWGHSGEDSAAFTLLPLVSYRRDRVETELLSPVFFTSSDNVTGRTVGGIPPLLTFWSFDETESAWGTFPLLYRSKGPTTAFTLTPLFYTSTDDVAQSESGGILPLLAFWKLTQTETSVGQFPLFFHWHDDHRTFNMVTPLMFGWSEPEFALSLALPMYVGWDTPTETFALLLPLLYARYRNESAQYHFGMLGPIYGYVDKERSGFGIWPLVWFRDDAESGDWQSALFPLYFGAEIGADAHHWFLPLLYGNSTWADGDSLFVLGPLYTSSFGGVERRGLFPVLHVESDPANGRETTIAAPLYLSHDEGETETRVFTPLLYFRHDDFALDEHLWFAGPLYAESHGDVEHYGLAPLFFHARDPGAAYALDLVPGLFTRLRTPDLEVDQWALGWRSETAERETWGLAPLGVYRHDKRDDGYELAVAPGFFLANGPDRFEIALGPLWHSRRGEVESDGFLPVFAHYHDGEGNGFTFLPGYLEIGSETGGWDFTWLLNGFRYTNDEELGVTLVAPLFLEAHDGRSGDWWALAPPWVYIAGNTMRDERLIFAPPFFTASSPTESGWFLFPLAFGHENAARSFWAVAPLALDWHDKTDDSHLTLVAGLFGRYTEGDISLIGRADAPAGAEAQDTGWLGPFVWSDTTRSRFRLLFPLVLDVADLDTGSKLFSLFPLYWRWQDQTDDLLRGLEAVVPFYVRYTETNAAGEVDTLTTIGPVFSYDGRNSSGFGLAPLFWHDRTRSEAGASGHDFVLPLVWSWFDEATESENLLAGPLYSFKQGSRESFGIFPLYLAGHAHTEQGEEGYSTIAPLYWHSYGFAADGLAEETLITPVGFRLRHGGDEHSIFLNYYRGISGDTQTDVVLPLLYSSRSPDRHTLAIAPLYWETDSPTFAARLVAPFYYASQDKVRGAETVWAFPYLGLRDATSETDIAFPFWFERRGTNGDLFRFVLPAYLQLEDGETGSQFVAGGPVWYHGAGDGSYDTGLFPLVWWGEEANNLDGYAVGFPLYWRFVDDEGADRWTIFGPTWLHEHPDGYSTGLFPLAFLQRDRAEHVFRAGVLPLYYQAEEGDESTLLAFPAWYHHTSPTQHTTIAPLFYHHDDTLAEQSLTIAGPWLHAVDRHGQMTGVLPFYLGRDNLDGSSWRFVLPNIVSTEEADGSSFLTVFPLFFGTDEADGSGTAVIPPLLFHAHNADDSEGYTIAGPYLDIWDPNTWLGGVVPFYFGYHATDRFSLDTVLGLAWWWTDVEEGDEGAIIGPVYHVSDAEGTAMGIAPLAHLETYASGGGRGWLLPLAYVDDDPAAGTDTVIAGPAFYHADEVAETLDWGVAPLFWRFDSPERSGSALFPAWYYAGRDDGHTFISPLVYSACDGDDFRAWSVLYTGWGDADETTHTFFPLFLSNRKKDGRGLDIALPVYAHGQSAGDQTGWTVAPLYFHNYDRAQNTSATVLFPFYWNFDGLKRDLTIIALWWQSDRKDIDRVSQGLVPLYYYTEDPHGYDFELLGGIFTVAHDKDRDESKIELLWIPL